MEFLEKVKIRIFKVEERENDSWFDMSLRQLREGKVRFYRVNDPLTGEWLFKICLDKETPRIVVKALKCPPGRSFAQLEGSAMLFQESLLKDEFYDVISLSYIDGEGRLRRNIIETVDEVPEIIKSNFKIMPFDEATGKKTLGKKIVTLCSTNDDKSMIYLFILERAWPLLEIKPDVMTKTFDLLKIINELERAELNEIYQAAMEEYGLTKDNTNILLKSLEEKGKITIQNGYVKIKQHCLQKT